MNLLLVLFTGLCSGPRSSERRFHGAVVLCLGLLSVFLLAGLIGLGVHRESDFHKLTSESTCYFQEHYSTLKHKHVLPKDLFDTLACVGPSIFTFFNLFLLFFINHILKYHTKNIVLFNVIEDEGYYYKDRI